MRARPYNLVLMLTSFDMGGTERQMIALAQRLDPRRFHLHLACFHDRGALRRTLPDAVTIRAFPVQGFGNTAALRQLRAFAAWCRAIRADLVHTCDLYTNIFGLPGAALAGVPARIANRREILTGDKTPTQLACQRLAYRLAHTVVANSAAALAQLRREGVSAPLRVIPNGLDCAAFVPPAPRTRIRRVVMVANLRPEKGHETVLRAAPQILERYPDATFTFAGDGPCRAALAAMVMELGLLSSVTLVGECGDVAGLLANSDLFVLPSRSEAFPNVVIEAMAAGVPVIASDVGGIPEVIRHGVNGLLVPPGDPRSLSEAVLALMDRPAEAASLGRAARADVTRNYTIDRMVARFEDVYLDTIERRLHGDATARELTAARGTE